MFLKNLINSSSILVLAILVLSCGKSKPTDVDNSNTGNNQNLLELSSQGSGVSGQAVIMNAGEAHGQLVFLTVEDVRKETPKYKALSPVSIPVFDELPLALSVVAGTITTKQQNVASHVQIKAAARKTPNLDISMLPKGINNLIFNGAKDGDWVYMKLDRNGTIIFKASSKNEALTFFKNRITKPVKITSDLSKSRLALTQNLGYLDYTNVGSKAANYAELAKALNTPKRTIVRNGYGIPFYHYNKFVNDVPEIKQAIQDILDDAIMDDVMDVQYRSDSLLALRELFANNIDKIDPRLIRVLVEQFDKIKSANGLPRKLKLRSSTNAEDLPNFNGAGLYTSKSYKPTKKKLEKSYDLKALSVSEALITVWSSVWTLRAFDERTYFKIPHGDIKMGIQVNPSFRDEDVDGVVITKNISKSANHPGAGVYIEAQRGDMHSVANPLPGVTPEKILVLIDRKKPLDTSKYKVIILMSSNIADDKETILPVGNNPKPVMTNKEIIDLAYQSLKAEKHFKPLLDKNNDKFALDLEFKVDSADTGKRQVYLKQARPFIGE